MGDEEINEETSQDDPNIRYPRKCRFSKRKTVKQICLKEERDASFKKVSAILQKSEELRTSLEIEILKEYSKTVEEIQSRRKKRSEAKRRLEEIEDPKEVLYEKCFKLAQAIAQAEYLIVYTGAGISTAAKIPDYRGPNGIWTKLQQGKDIGKHDLSSAEPTYTHMALSELYRQKILKYVVSQNCDGLHLRSSLPRFALSELHGNMYIEVCKNCKPPREYLRLFDVTEKTARFSHKTGRNCYFCNCPLVDTIVHFGERGSLSWPLNWAGACKNAKRATTILCLGSSLKVLKRYPWLWQMDKPLRKRPNLYIVNLQWTPKDDCANMKIHGQCDTVMKVVMDMLGIQVPDYDRNKDPIFFHATYLSMEELHSTTKSFLKINSNAKTDEKICISQKDENISSSSVKEESASPMLNNKKCESALPGESIFKSEIKLESLSSAVFPNPVSKDDSLVKEMSNFNCNVREKSESYSNIYFYPYQTSFLYSGLHSIINPSLFNALCNWNIDNLTNFDRYFNILNQRQNENCNSFNILRNSFCEFCYKQYTSPYCLFYDKIDFHSINSVAKKIETSVPFKTQECDENEVTDCNTKKGQISIKTHAGWFGKGYRIKRKRKS